MWIRSQDKKYLIEPVNINVERNLGGKHKYILMATGKGISAVIVGQFLTQEEAYLELDHIQSFIEMNPEGIYQVR